MLTPSDLNIKKWTHIPPADGWEPQTYYLVEVAFSSGNPIKRYFFYSGFINDGKPSGYNCLLSPTGDDKPPISRIYYLKALTKIDMEQDYD